jgi:hypothetical protein
MADDTLVRWEQTRREALGTAVTLLFGLSSGALAFCGSLLTADHVQFGGTATTRFLIAAGIFILCLLASVAVTITRLLDFRTTADVVRKREAGDDPDGLERLRCRARCLGSWTWFLFYVQIGSFLLSAVVLMFALWSLFHQRLFP